MYYRGALTLSRANDALLAEATPEQLQSLLSVYMTLANAKPEEDQKTVEVDVTMIKPMASLAAQSLTRMLSKKNFGGTISDTSD